jgi:hypothetical protein
MVDLVEESRQQTGFFRNFTAKNAKGAKAEEISKCEIRNIFCIEWRE